jgi:hypothetical protein
LHKKFFSLKFSDPHQLGSQGVRLVGRRTPHDVAASP